MGKVLRKVMPKSYILVPGYGAQGGKGKDLVHFFNEDGLGAIVNSSRGIIAAYKQEKYAEDVYKRQVLNSSLVQEGLKKSGDWKYETSAVRKSGIKFGGIKYTLVYSNRHF